MQFIGQVAVGLVARRGHLGGSGGARGETAMTAMLKTFERGVQGTLIRGESGGRVEVIIVRACVGGGQPAPPRRRDAPGDEHEGACTGPTTVYNRSYCNSIQELLKCAN